jgi:prophage antirepressor-like protein
MEVVKAFNTNNLHTEIVIIGSTTEPLFRASDIGEVLNISTIRSVIRDFDKSEKIIHSIQTIGGIQDVTFLTEKGLYKVLFKSRKPIAEKFQNWVCEVIKEIRLNETYTLKKQIETNNFELTKKIGKEREQILLKEFGDIGAIIYIIKIKTYENEEYIIKIGESRRGVQGRYNEHKTHYGDILLLDCFSVKRSKDFENFIHNHDKIKTARVTDLEGHHTERELFKIGQSLTYKMVLQIIEQNIRHFNEYNNEYIEKMQNEINVLTNLLEPKTNEITVENTLLKNLFSKIENLEKTNQEILLKMENLEKTNQEILSKITPATKTTTNFNTPLQTLGPRLQKINPETLALVKVYESVNECLQDSKFVLKRPSINKAIVENTIYHGYRWKYVDRNIDPHCIQGLEPTKQTRPQNVGYVAKLNGEKTEILRVYIDRKTAAKQNGFESASALDIPVKTGKLCHGNYFVLYEKCSDVLQTTFEEKHGEVILYKNGVGVFNTQNELQKEYSCKYDCIKHGKISEKTLKRALDKKIMYNDCYYRSLEEKLSI